MPSTAAILGELWELAKHAGPFSSMLLLYLYLDERKERRATAAKLNDVLERSIQIISEVRTTMETWLNVFARGARK